MSKTTDLITMENAMLGKTYAETNQVIGIGQTWQDVTAQRTYSTDGGATNKYTNTTGKPIFVSVSVNPSTSVNASLVINGVSVATKNDDATAAAEWGQICGIVNNNEDYYISMSAGTIDKWSEFR